MAILDLQDFYMNVIECLDFSGIYFTGKAIHRQTY